MKLQQRWWAVATCITFIVTSSLVATPIEISNFSANHTLLTFDELVSGTVLDNEYGSLGVTFSGTTGLEGSGNATLIKVQARSSSPSSKYIGLKDNGWAGSVILDFNPDFYITQVGGMLVSAYSTLAAYDLTGKLIERAQWAGAELTSSDFAGIGYSGGISRAIFYGPFNAFDDFRFATGTPPPPVEPPVPVPEPSAIWLLSIGLLSFFGFVRRFKK